VQVQRVQSYSGRRSDGRGSTCREALKRCSAARARCRHPNPPTLQPETRKPPNPETRNTVDCGGPAGVETRRRSQTPPAAFSPPPPLPWPVERVREGVARAPPHVPPDTCAAARAMSASEQRARNLLLSRLELSDAKGYAPQTPGCIGVCDQEQGVDSGGPTGVEMLRRRTCQVFTHHGVSNTHHGVSNTHHGLSDTHHGVSNTHHGVSHTHHNVSNTHPGVSNNHHGVSNTHPGVRHTGVSVSRDAAPPHVPGLLSFPLLLKLTEVPLLLRYDFCLGGQRSAKGISQPVSRAPPSVPPSPPKKLYIKTKTSGVSGAAILSHQFGEGARYRGSSLKGKRPAPRTTVGP